MKLFGRRQAVPAGDPPDGGFGEWLLRQFAGGRPMADLPYAEVERLCANAGSLLVGAVHARPGAFEGVLPDSPELRTEAALLARRTADGFKASLADRRNAVIAWPWDHMATTIAWEATRASDTSESSLGRAMLNVGGAYALRHREQVAAVLDLWAQIAGTVRTTTAAKADLARMGAEMLEAYEVSERAVVGAGVSAGS